MAQQLRFMLGHRPFLRAQYPHDPDSIGGPVRRFHGPFLAALLGVTRANGLPDTLNLGNVPIFRRLIRVFDGRE